MADQEKKIPHKCRKIHQELQKKAPGAVHYKDLAFLCNISTFELGFYLNSYPEYFHNVEKIKTDNWVKYRLNLQLQAQEFEERTPDLSFRDKIQLFFEKRKH